MTTAGWTNAQNPSSIKKGGLACQRLGNFDMHMEAKCDQNIPCGSRVMNIFTSC